MATVKFSKALERLDEIMGKIESEEMDIDELAKSVKEAVGLIQTCKEKIRKAELEVQEAIKDFESGQGEEMDEDEEDEDKDE